MKKTVPAIPLAGLLLSFIGISCVRFVPTALEDPPVMFNKIVFSAGLDQKSGWAEPVGVKTRFEKGTDPSVYSFLSFGELRGGHTLRWRWYDPGRKLFRLTDPIDIGEEGKVFERYIAWDVISLSADKSDGVWTIAVFLDDRLIASGEFEIK
jgi:hypothetical protein